MVEEKQYRNLASKEITALESNGCSCENWKDVRVLDGFIPSYCVNVIFSGRIRLGIFGKRVKDESGVTTFSGIFNAHINNCSVGSGVVIRIVKKWKKSVVDLDNMLYEDARKEFALSSMTGFGIDGGYEIKKQDFEQVRGEFESNSVVAAIRDHIKQKSALGDELIERMKMIKH